ncbi:MAG: AAA family ATPase [Acetatifactor sp.]|nr:AAA family ATPase [Acetatifactor sp.]
MGYSMDDIFGAFGSNSGRSSTNYTVEEIEAAKKRQKKCGGTFLENLEAVAPEKAAAKATQAPINMQAMQSAASKAESALAAVEKARAATTADINASIKELNASMATDFGIKEAEAKPLTDPAQILDNFNGLTDALKEKVYGQDDFLKKLVISFKRPFVTERDNNDAMNSIFITGPACTGKHHALTTLVAELQKRRILESSDITTINLALYPTANEEKLFLQDLYAALQSKSSVIVFENIETCHISMLTRLSDLVTTGECKLSERYIMQNGQLINVANAFAGNTIGSFEAKGKYLIFLSPKPLDKLAGVMGAPFVNALGDICIASSLNDEAMKKVAADREAQLIEKSKKQLSYDLTIEESFREYILSQTSKGRALQGILDAYGNTARALTELRLERDDLSTNALILKCEESPVIVAGEETISFIDLLPGGYNGELEAVKAEMESIVGLKTVKEYIYSLEEYFGVQKRRREAGLKAGEVNKHMIFTGNPGTGKTTIARIVSKYLKAIGVLSGGQLVEVSRADLVGRYVGHTAPLVNQVVKSALGGVLFIDEAYSLHRGKEDSFGLEAIDTLVKAIEDNRDDLIVILAGYSNEMSEFLESNSGLKSRFPNIIDFPDYTAEELLAIGKLTAKSKGYVIDESAEQPLLDYFAVVQATRAMDAGNGRLVRNKLEEAILNQSRRLVAEPDADMSLLLDLDFDLTD